MALTNLNLRTARSQIEDGIITYILEALGKRYATVADTTALRAVPSTGLDIALRYVTARLFVYRWFPFDTTVDDDDTAIRPADVAFGLPGRWLKTSSQNEAGGYQLPGQPAVVAYLHRVQLFNDSDHGEEIALERLFADTPAVLLSFHGASHKPVSQEPGALYWYTARFTLLAVSQSARGGGQETARRGSLMPAEAAVDPGTAAIIGDLKAVLAGTNIGIKDVARCEIGDEGPVDIELAVRRSFEELDIIITATLTNGDMVGTSVVLGTWAFDAHYELATTPAGQAYDIGNNILSASMQLSPTNSLSATIGAGTATIAGLNYATITMPATAHTFGDNRATYRDLIPDAQDPTGTYFFTETLAGDPPPPVYPGALRVAVTITDGGKIASDTLLCSAALPFGPPDHLMPHVVSIAVTPTNVSLPAGTHVQYTATATYESGETADITQQVLWSIDDPAPVTATVNPQGAVICVAAGPCDVVARYQGVRGLTFLTVF